VRRLDPGDRVTLVADDLADLGMLQVSPSVINRGRNQIRCRVVSAAPATAARRFQLAPRASMR